MIARSLADQLAKSRASLFLLGRSAERLELMALDLKLRHGVEVETEAIDFDDFKLHAPAIDRAINCLGGLDLAIICHGSLGDQKACERDCRLAEAEFRINFLSPISFLEHLAHRFEEIGSGCLIAISSVAGERGRQSNYIYGAAKAGLSVYLQGLRNRLYPRGVHVLTVKPGFVDTPMTAHLKKGLLMASPERVAKDILRGAKRGACVIYTPWFWRWILWIIKMIPESIFRKLRL